MRGARAGLVGLGVALTAFFVYSPVLSNPFVNADDRWVFSSPVIREGRLLTMVAPRPDRAGYMPAGYMLLAGVYRAGRAQLKAFHLASLLLHAANSGLLFFLLLSLMRIASADLEELESARLACAALASVFFAVHPIQAEAIAVASSLSDLAAAFFALASVILYVRAAGRVGGPAHRRLLGASLALAAVSGLTRWTGAGLAAVLLILDAYPLRRLDRRALLEKIPYVLVGVVVIALNSYAKMSPSTVGGVHSLGFRPGGVAAGVVFYAWKWLVPGEYSLYYILDRPSELMGLPVWGCALLALAAAALLVRFRRRAPAALAAFGIYLVVLAPVLLATNNGWVLAHNRYAYLPGMALAGAASAGLLVAWRRRLPGKHGVHVPFAVLAAFCALLGAQSRALAAQWHDKSRHWAATLSTDPDAFFSFNELGEEMLRRKDYGSAVQQFRDRLDDHPEDEHARRRLAEYGPLLEAYNLNDRGVALVCGGDLDAAAAHFRRAIGVMPDLAIPYKNLAAVLRRQGRAADAEAVAERARGLEARKPASGPARRAP